MAEGVRQEGEQREEEEILKEWEVGGIGGKYATTNCF